jgi:antirestriction protein ArdC
MKKHDYSTGKHNLYQFVTNQIINLLENHQLSWDKPWVTITGDGKRAHNAISGRKYSGLNQILLSIRQFKSGYPYGGWLTFHQINKAGGRVIFGEKSSEIFFHQITYYDKEGHRYEPEQAESLTKQKQEQLDLKKRWVLRHYRLFNIAQTSGLPDELYELEQMQNLTDIGKDERTEDLIKATGAFIIHIPKDEACYDFVNDVICLPDLDRFVDTAAYYDTLLHELGHWTGHESRLNRKLRNAFGSEDYAKEELIAELCASFLCAELGFSRVITNNAAYIQSWISVLKNDHRYIFKAVRDAEKAADFINAFELKTEG